MKENDNYCGYSCDGALQEEQRILDEVIDFSKHNPQYALVVLGKLMDIVYYIYCSFSLSITF